MQKRVINGVHHYYGTDAEMLAMTSMIVYEQFIVDTGTNAGNKYEYRGATAGWVQTHDASGAAHVAEQGIIGGGRSEATQANNHTVTRHESNAAILNSVTTIQAVSGGVPASLMGIQIHTALSGTLTITGFTNVAGTATPWVIPSGSVGAVQPPGLADRCETALSATLSDPLDYNKVKISWRPIS